MRLLLLWIVCWAVVGSIGIGLVGCGDTRPSVTESSRTTPENEIQEPPSVSDDDSNRDNDVQGDNAQAVRPGRGKPVTTNEGTASDKAAGAGQADPVKQGPPAVAADDDKPKSAIETSYITQQFVAAVAFRPERILESSLAQALPPTFFSDVTGRKGVDFRKVVEGILLFEPLPAGAFDAAEQGPTADPPPTKKPTTEPKAVVDAEPDTSDPPAEGEPDFRGLFIGLEPEPELAQGIEASPFVFDPKTALYQPTFVTQIYRFDDRFEALTFLTSVTIEHGLKIEETFDVTASDGTTREDIYYRHVPPSKEWVQANPEFNAKLAVVYLDEYESRREQADEDTLWSVVICSEQQMKKMLAAKPTHSPLVDRLRKANSEHEVSAVMVSSPLGNVVAELKDTLKSSGAELALVNSLHSLDAATISLDVDGEYLLEAASGGDAESSEPLWLQAKNGLIALLEQRKRGLAINAADAVETGKVLLETEAAVDGNRVRLIRPDHQRLLREAIQGVCQAISIPRQGLDRAIPEEVKKKLED